MAKRDQAHRIEWEMTALHMSGRFTARGQYLGFAASVIGMTAAVVLALNGGVAVPIALSLGSFAGFVGLIWRGANRD